MPLNPIKKLLAFNNSRLFWEWNHIHSILFLLAINFSLSLFIGFIVHIFVSLNVPDISSLASYQPSLTTSILDENGEVIDQVYDQNRFVVPLSEMPGILPKAFVAAEDGRFYEHSGVDGWSILRAFIHNMKAGGRSQGGSTITQQVARSLLLSPEKTYTRKIREAILAYRIDRLLSKNEILHIYLNQIYLGEGAYGVEAASQTYFDKHTHELSLAEISLMAGLPQAPSRYSPFKHYKLARKRQVYVLNRMAEVGFIESDDARKAYQQVLLWKPQKKQATENAYFVQHVKNYIEQKYGHTLLTTGGLSVHTTLDPSLQKTARRAIKKGIKAWTIRHQFSSNLPEPPQAALVAMEVGSGRLKAIIGGTNFSESQFNRATQALRQPGSAFKPIIYAAALAKGLTPATLIIDEPLQLQGVTTDHTWEPKNFDGTFRGPTTLRNGLVFSRNIVTIKILQENGINGTIKMARQLGIHSPLAENLSLALGVSGVSLLDLTTAYAVFARAGNYMEPLFITKITDRNGAILEQNTPVKNQIMDERTAYQITHLLKHVVNDGTGRKAKGLRTATAGKTGTTDKNMDAWFVGYTPDLVAGVWLGYDQKTSLGENETGGRAAAPIWLDFMKNAGEYLTTENFAIPDGVTLIPMNNETGEISAGAGENTSWEAFRNDNLPDVEADEENKEDDEVYITL